MLAGTRCATGRLLVRATGVGADTQWGGPRPGGAGAGPAPTVASATTCGCGPAVSITVSASALRPPAPVLEAMANLPSGVMSMLYGLKAAGTSSALS